LPDWGATELYVKRLELLKEAVPRVERIAVLISPTTQTPRALKPVESAARALQVTLYRVEVQRADELERAFSTIAQGRADAVLIAQDQLLNVNVRKIADLATKNRLPSSGTRDFADAGGVIGYGMDFADNGRRTARFVDRILRGAKPADLPVEQPIKFELVINLKTAKALGLMIPQTLLERADQLIQ
jgi:putative tryptophan/tyrosine transport system substrate-binding protein